MNNKHELKELISNELEQITGGCQCFCHTGFFPDVRCFGTADSAAQCQRNCERLSLTYAKCT